jgi:hypothetical protein
MTDQSPAIQSSGKAVTPEASRYLQQLCKHFQHKRPVSRGALSDGPAVTL